MNAMVPAIPNADDVDPWADLQRTDERRQPFDWGSILPPLDVDADGPMSHRESVQLGKLHAARNGTARAAWMRGAILESINRRRLYRGESGERSFPEYLDQEWDGLSESGAYREIEEWRMGYAISQIWEGIVPSSHVRALLPLEAHGPRPVIAQAYGRMRAAWQSDGLRLTEAHIRGQVRAAVGAAGKLRELEDRTDEMVRKLDELADPTTFRRTLAQRPKAPALPAPARPVVDGEIVNDRSQPSAPSIDPFRAAAATGATQPAPGPWNGVRAWCASEGADYGLSADEVGALLLEALDRHPRLVRELRAFIAERANG